MRLATWAYDPLSNGPPPIPLSTDVVNASNPGYRVGAIPPRALADDLAALALSYEPGRGNGYRRHGERIDPYEIGDLIAELFDDAAIALRYFLDTDERMLRVKAERAQLDALPFRDRDEAYFSATQEIRHRLEHLEANLPHSRAALELAADSLAATAGSIRGILYVRREAVRRFRSAMPSPPRSRPSSMAAVAAFLQSVPSGEVISRTDLHADATAAGLFVGSRTLYAAAARLGWPLIHRKGYAYFRVPEAP
jgi:hypothetical protein